MAENKFSLDAVDFRSGGINDLPELAVGTRPNPDETREVVSSSALKANQASVTPVEENAASSPVEEPPKGLWGLVRKMRSTLPIMAKVLPLLDNGIATALAPVLAPQPTVNTKAIERSIAEVQSAQRDLRTHVQNHALQLKRVEEQLGHVREEVDRNTREQQSKLEEIRSSIGTVKIIGILVVLLLLLGVGLEGWILFRKF